MNYELLVDAATTEATTQETKPTTAVPVEKVLAAIVRDSRRDAQQYLDDSVTPFGGE